MKRRLIAAALAVCLGGGYAHAQGFPVTVQSSGTTTADAAVTTAPPSYTTGTTQALSLTTSGQLRVTALPSAAGYAASATTVAVSSGTPVTLFGAAGISNGCFVQNPSSNAVALIVDWGGGTPASPVAAQSLDPGVTASCAAAYTNAITMWLASGTTSVTVYAGRY